MYTTYMHITVVSDQYVNSFKVHQWVIVSRKAYRLYFAVNEFCGKSLGVSNSIKTEIELD